MNFLEAYDFFFLGNIKEKYCALFLKNLWVNFSRYFWSTTKKTGCLKIMKKSPNKIVDFLIFLCKKQPKKFKKKEANFEKIMFSFLTVLLIGVLHFYYFRKNQVT